MSASAPQRDRQFVSGPAFQAGSAAAVQDAKQHRRRNHLLDDLPGLTAFASDSALLASRGAAAPLRDEDVKQYIAGYVAAYQEALGRSLAGGSGEPAEPEKPGAIGRGRLQPMALRRNHRPARKPARVRR